MRKTAWWMMLGAMCGMLAACQPDAATRASSGATGVVDGHNSRTSLDWDGVYQGMLPCADCEGIETIVTLTKDGRYVHKSRYEGKSDEWFEHKGKISWSPDGGSIRLGKGENAVRYQVGENLLLMLDREGKRISGELAIHYRLAKQPQASLTETHWKLVELMGKPVADSQNEPHILLQKDDGRFHGSGGCNRIGGGYELKPNGRIRFTKGISTRMACINGMEVEAQLMDVLTRADSYVIVGNALQLNRARMAPLARFEAVKVR